MEDYITSSATPDLNVSGTGGHCADSTCNVNQQQVGSIDYALEQALVESVYHT
jgi:hypothetical protein